MLPSSERRERIGAFYLPRRSGMSGMVEVVTKVRQGCPLRLSQQRSNCMWGILDCDCSGRETSHVKDEVLCIDVTVTNSAKAAKKFEVGVKVDDGAFFFAGPEAEKEVKAGAKQAYKTQSALTTPYPKKLAIKVAPLWCFCGTGRQ